MEIKSKELGSNKVFHHNLIEFHNEDIKAVRTLTGSNTKKNFLESSRISKSSQQLYRNKAIYSGSNKNSAKNSEQNQELAQVYDKLVEGRISDYKNEEDNLKCYRFPHLNFCACCPETCQPLIQDPFFVEVLPGLFIGSLYTSLSTKLLLKRGITHILNVSATEYTKRTRYFKYLTIDVFEASDEDIKKYFRLANRFIYEAKKQNGQVLIHCQSGKGIAICFAIAYLINHEKIPLKIGFEGLNNEMKGISITAYFYKQLEQYDLEKLVMMKSEQNDVI